jgi:hypothetical protein
MIDIIYPYIETLATWKELKYSIRSIHQHLIGTDYRIWLISEHKLPWLQDVNYIIQKREFHPHRTNCLDATRRLKKVIDHPLISEDFLLMYDDIYFLHDTRIEEIPQHLAVDKVIIDGQLLPASRKGSGSRKWRSLLYDTCKALIDDDIHPYNYETHLPRRFNKWMMQNIYDLYNPIENRLLTSTLYYSHLFNDCGAPEFLPNTLYKAGYYGQDLPGLSMHANEKTIQEGFASRRFLNHDDNGLNASLRQAIEGHYPDPSPYEVD